MELDDGTTLAERKLRDVLTESLSALRDRDYESLEGLLTSAALDARSLRLLGPEGSQGIPVDSYPQAPADARPLFEIVAERVALGRHPDGFSYGDPVVETRPCPACGAALRPEDTHWSLWPEPMGGYVCPAVDDAPAGAGHSVEADRG